MRIGSLLEVLQGTSRDITESLQKHSWKELRSLLDELNLMDRGEASQVVTEVLKRIMDRIEL